MGSLTCTLTERGQISLPSSLRKKMGLLAGQKLRWEAISPTEARIVVEPKVEPNPLEALGFGPRLRGEASRRTADWMAEMRSAE